jgi:ketosteroid isomerase-like protein
MPATPAERFELRDLVDAYATAIDERDTELLVSLFTPDAHLFVVEDGREEELASYRGAAELARLMDRLGQYGSTMHLISNHRLEVDGNSATGVAYCLAHHLTEREGATQDLVMAIRYFDRYERVSEDGAWRIAERKIVRYWDELRPILDERVSFVGVGSR